MRLIRGRSTALPFNLRYRLGRLRAQGLVKGTWLDCGCATGGYARALAESGAALTVGIDLDGTQLATARRLATADGRVHFTAASAQELPFPDCTFDGVLLSEVLEHVADEGATLAEIRRVLRPNGYLVLSAPNRLFPFEGHGMRVWGHRIEHPIPLLPWAPSAVSRNVMVARNYWPWQLRRHLRRAGFEVVWSRSLLPVLEQYQWLPRSLIKRYRRAIPAMEGAPVLRHLGVSTLVLARRPA